MKKGIQLSVSAIENGTVIDHIPSNNLFKVIQILGLDKSENLITFGTNLESDRMGSKAIIKIADRYFEEEDINRIALVAPEAKLNIIRGYEVVEKNLVKVPEKIKGIAKCFNPKCITNHEGVVTKFDVTGIKPLVLKCHYCEKVTDEEHLTII